jgi:hypothetical protein
MVHKILIGALLVIALVMGLPAGSAAQQSVSVQVGGFFPNGESSRSSGDVLAINREYLLFDFGDFKGFQIGGEWSAALGEFIEAGAGFGYYQSTVPAVYAEWINEDGSEIEQDLSLRIMPLTAVVRVLPLGSKRAFQPYVGGGLGVYFWRYRESGEFLGDDGSIFADTFEQSGTSVGPVVVFGVRGAVSGSSLIGVEGRYQWGTGDLNEDFLGDKIDLGGFSLLATFGYRF